MLLSIFFILLQWQQAATQTDKHSQLNLRELSNVVALWGLGYFKNLKRLKKWDKNHKGNEGETHAVKDVSFELQKAQTLAIVGESGSGKSTLGKTIINVCYNRGMWLMK